MAHRQEAPYRPQDPHEVTEMIRGLEGHLKKGKGGGGFSVKRTIFDVPGKPGHQVQSWRMQDWDYKKPNLPTYARGLFTRRKPNGEWEIVTRGYDKFFNHGEIRKTEWDNVSKNTRGPYELSVKENGCIIFISGFDDETLLVCSKHSTGAREDVEMSHAVAGERWVDRQLEQLGKTRADLARTLRAMNATAVAELCDDEFEEHVLAYNPESAGLYLHGINLNLPEFVTYPGHLVDRFATDWGFKKTMYVMEDDIKKVKSFLDGVAETGAYAGRETEGFVIRCQAVDFTDGPWHDWFFKYKFEEPYLMYRQWRECTKAIIAGRPPKYKKHKQITEEYLTFAKQQLAKDPKLGKLYNQNHGIIKLRDNFLASRGLKGSDIIRQELENGEVGDMQVTHNVVLVPVATIGCGKTTLALSLVKLFGWGHFQNDNIEGRQRRPERFASAICQNLASHPVVIADRNNHQARERRQIIEDIQRIVPSAKFVALHYVHERDRYDQIRHALQDRVFSRGDNHQTIQAVTKGKGEIVGIMDGFLQRFQPVDPSNPPDDAFDLVIDLDPTADTRENLEIVVAKLEAEFPKLFGTMPTSDDLDAAVQAALDSYRPDFKMDLSKPQKGYDKKNKGRERQTQTEDENTGPTKPKEKKIEFFCIRLSAGEINRILDAVFRNEAPEVSRFYKQLQGSRRIQSEFHVTLIHKASSTQHPSEWQSLVDLYKDASKEGQFVDPELGKCEVLLERVVWDDRVMCIVVRLINDTKKGAADGEFKTVNPLAHITIGTANQNIKPKESNDLLQKWLNEGAAEGNGIRDVKVKGHVMLWGTARAVMSR